MCVDVVRVPARLPVPWVGLAAGAQTGERMWTARECVCVCVPTARLVHRAH